MIKTCIICSREFKVRGLRRKLTAKFCSLTCAEKKRHEYFINNDKHGFKKGQTPWNKGKKYPQFSEGKSIRWSGDRVGYQGVHHWINKKLGKPKECQFCSTTEGRIEWANKTGEYKRDTSDWINLCRKCHFVYDKQNLRERGYRERFL